MVLLLLGRGVSFILVGLIWPPCNNSVLGHGTYTYYLVSILSNYSHCEDTNQCKHEITLGKLFLLLSDQMIFLVGANDVSMIQMADVGVGICGQEGRQAVMASDFAMGQFRFLKRLLLVHGHWNYQRIGYLVLYNFYRNAVFVLMLFWYAWLSFMSDLNLMHHSMCYMFRYCLWWEISLMFRHYLYRFKNSENETVISNMQYFNLYSVTNKAI